MPAIEATRLPALARSDRVLRAALRDAKPLRFAVATAPGELEAALRLRYDCVVGEGWARAGDFPDGLERDRYDDEALQIVAWDGHVAAGTARLVLPLPGEPLPTEEAFKLAIEPTGEVVDGGRLVVARPYRRNVRCLLGLFARAWLEGRARGFRLFAGAAPLRDVAPYRKLGLEVSVLGAPTEHWSEERVPILLSGIAARR